MSVAQILPVLCVFLLAGAVKGVTGMGLPTVAMSLLGLWMMPAQAAALLVVPALATNIAQCRGPQLGALIARLWPGLTGLAALTVLAPGLGSAGQAEATGRWLGAILIAYGLLGLWRPILPDLSGRGRWLSAPIGAATGAVTALTAVFALPWVPYLQTLRLDKDAMVQALGLSFTVATLALAARLQLSARVGTVEMPDAFAVFGALVGAFAGLWLGALLRGRLGGAAFQKALFMVFIVLGAANLLRPD